MIQKNRELCLRPIRQRVGPLFGVAAVSALALSACAPADFGVIQVADESRAATAQVDAALRANPQVGSVIQRGQDWLRSKRAELALDQNHDFRARSVIRDDLGEQHLHVDQMYRGVRVWAGDAIVRLDRAGDAQSIISNVHAGMQLDVTPAFDDAQVRRLVHEDLRPSSPYASAPTSELIVYPESIERAKTSRLRGPGGELNAQDLERVVTGYRLAYHVHTEIEAGAANTRHTDYIVDARTGATLKKWSTLYTAAAIGTGNSHHSGSVQIGTDSIAGAWQMKDVGRSMNFTTYNLNHGTSGTGTVFTDTDNTWGDGANYIAGGSTTNANGQTAGVDAHYGIARTFDYYMNVHGRNGIDGVGTATYNRVHYSTNYVNAFWSDSCFCMTYGDGNASYKVLTSLDVAGHEMTHGVTSRTANLIYSGESGGLNESMSDIHGTMVEFYARGGSGSTIGNTGGNWNIGEQLSATPLRYMTKPSLDGASPDAWSGTLGSIDVHYSSGPSNRMFYFLSQGASAVAGSETYSSYLPGGMSGIGNDEAARISFRALTVKMTASTNYAGARTAYLDAATDLYGLNSVQYQAVQNAFAAINVGLPASSDTTAPTTALTAPTAGADLVGTVTLSADANDNVGVARVDFFVGTTLVGSDTTAHYSISWNSADVVNGAYAFTSKAYDAAGNVATSAAVSANVNNPVGSCTAPSQLLGNPGFESGATIWSATAGVIHLGAADSHTGSYQAWLNGYGSTHTDTLSQAVTIPSTACSATLSFWLKITTSETTKTAANDKLTVQLLNGAGTVLTTLVTYSNLNKSAYVQRSFNVAAYKGQTVTVKFTGTENASRQTSFFVDDTALNIVQ